MSRDVGRYLDSEDGAIFSSIMLRAKDAEGNTHPISQDMLEVFARSVFYSAPREYRMTFVRELIQNPQLFCIRPKKQYIACDKNVELRTLKWFAEGMYLPSTNNLVVANNWMSRIPLSDVLTRENVDSSWYSTSGEELELDLMHILVDNGAFIPEKMNVLFDRRFNYFHVNKEG
ncbi:MAG: hypothetical protein FJZ57_03870, partial [Chlamydiae bacterium]|nr:hypothetical protein [Chlamydiota bacterium]